jgi:hypothetical protein
VLRVLLSVSGLRTFGMAAGSWIHNLGIPLPFFIDNFDGMFILKIPARKLSIFICTAEEFCV